jgi:uncharacterized membrane protein HdeD (DUF308 family)
MANCQSCGAPIEEYGTDVVGRKVLSHCSNCLSEGRLLEGRPGIISRFVGDAARNWWMLTVRGVLAILFGVLFLIWPGPFLLGMVLLFGAWAFADGIVALAAAVSWGRRHWGTLLLEGIAGIAAGALTFFRPGITAVALYAIIAVWSIFIGLLEIGAAIRFRKVLPQDGWLAFAGIAQIVFGILLIALPQVGFAALAWLIGIFAIIFGANLVGLGFRLKRLVPAEAPAPPGRPLEPRPV